MKVKKYIYILIDPIFPMSSHAALHSAFHTDQSRLLRPFFPHEPATLKSSAPLPHHAISAPVFYSSRTMVRRTGDDREK